MENEHNENLWLAVINRIILDLRSSDRELRTLAKKWLFTDNEDFLTICYMLGICSKSIIEKLNDKEELI